MYAMTAKRIFKLGLINFWRNRWLSLAASLMIMLTLLSMGIFALLNVFVNSTAQGIKDRLDLSVYFYEKATDEQIKDLQYSLANRPDVKNVKYISKDEAYAIWLQRPLSEKIKNLITKDQNPLPRSLQIKAVDPESLATIAQELSTPKYQTFIREISYQKTKAAIDRILSLTNFVHRMGWVLTVFLLLISLIVILNTIRLTIFTRRDEIEIMRLVGANGAFIRIPFSVEAILYGLVGSLLAYVIVAVLMFYFGPRLAPYADIATNSTTRYFYLIRPYFDAVSGGSPMTLGRSFLALWQLGLMQLVVGMIFSVSCSMIAIRRYLHT